MIKNAAEVATSAAWVSFACHGLCMIALLARTIDEHHGRHRYGAVGALPTLDVGYLVA